MRVVVLMALSPSLFHSFFLLRPDIDQKEACLHCFVGSPRYKPAISTPSDVDHLYDNNLNKVATSDYSMSESWQTPEAWQGTFAFRVGELLDPQSELARKLPHLHQILQGRLTTTFAARGDHGISQCTHTNLPGFEGERSDGPRFQQQEDSDLMNAVHPIWDNSNRRAKHLCGNLTERMEVYGLVGAGSIIIPFPNH